MFLHICVLDKILPAAPSPQKLSAGLSWSLRLTGGSTADNLISVSGLCRRWSTVQFTHLFTFTCAAAADLWVFTLRNRSFAALPDRISTCQSLCSRFSFCASAAVVEHSSSAALGGNRLVNQWIKPTHNLQEIPAGRRSYGELQSCLKEKWNNRLL